MVADVEVNMIYALVSGGKYLHGLYTSPRKAAEWLAKKEDDRAAITAILATGKCYGCWILIPWPVDSEIKDVVCIS